MALPGWLSAEGSGALSPGARSGAYDPGSAPPPGVVARSEVDAFPDGTSQGGGPVQGRKMPLLEPIWVAFVAVVLAG